MRHLNRWIASKVADARDATVRFFSETLSTHKWLSLACIMAVVPVLAKEAVVTAGAIEDREVGIAHFSSVLISIPRMSCASATGAEPPSDTVGR